MSPRRDPTIDAISTIRPPDDFLERSRAQ